MPLSRTAVKISLLEDGLVELSKPQATPHQFKVSKSRKRVQQVEKLEELCEPLPAGDIVTSTYGTIADVQHLLDTTSLDAVGDLDPVDHARKIPETTPFYHPFCIPFACGMTEKQGHESGRMPSLVLIV